MSIKKANKVSSIPRSILLYESIVDIDIDRSKVSSIISTSISIFDIKNPAMDGTGVLKILVLKLGAIMVISSRSGNNTASRNIF